MSDAEDRTQPTSGKPAEDRRASVIHEGLPTQLPDIDPEETQDWIESFDAMRRRPRSRPGPLRDAAPARAGARAAGRRAGAAQHRLHQHHPARARAVVPRRRGDRAPDPGVHPLERRRDGLRRQPARPRGRRPHRDLPVGREPLRGRLQPLLPRQGPPRRRRPDLHPGPRLPGHLRPRLPRGPAHRGAADALPPGGAARRRQGPAVVPAPAADAGVLGVPDRLDGPDRDQLDLPGAVQPLHAEPRHQGHLRAARLGLPRRRRDGRARVARRDRRRRARGARQPHLGDQLQPAAARRPGARQRQDHPGAGVQLPRRRLERDQGDLGPRVGRPARPRRRRRPGQPDEQHPRRRSSRPTRSRTAPTTASTSSARTRGCARWSST